MMTSNRMVVLLDNAFPGGRRRQENLTRPAACLLLLIAEDHGALRKQLQQILETEAGLTVETTGNGEEALDLLTRGNRPFSLFLTDLKLPGLDGLQLIERIQKLELDVTPIVFTA